MTRDLLLVLLVAASSAGPYVAPIAALVGGLAVAAIAAITADRRLAKQFAAEQQRHAARLDHERALTDLADLRSLCDEAALALRDLTDAKLAPTADGAVAPGVDSATAMRNLDSLAARFHVRLGPTDKITIAFAEAHSAARDLAAAPAHGERTRCGSFDEAAGDQALRLAIDDFLDAAVERAGAVPMLAPR